MEIITRFAPSPTGWLHVGNVRTAIINYLFAKAHNGKFMLRIDDTDLERSKQEYANAIVYDLNWLGLKWDIFAKQSERFERYNMARDQLIADCRLYECYETVEELDAKRKLQLSSGRPPIYDRAALKLSDAQKQEYKSQGRRPHYRFLLKDTPIVWKDLVRGDMRFEASNLSDPILIREDGTMTYMISSTIDDIDFCISHVIRGEDHLSNTALQLQLFEAMGAVNLPIFGHLSLITSKEEKISKTVGGFDIKSLREDSAILPMAIHSLFSALGSSMHIVPYKNLLEIPFDISKFSRNPANYSFEDLLRLNHKIITQMSFEEAKDIMDHSMNEMKEEFWYIIRPNLNNLKEAKLWWDIYNAEEITHNVDQDFLSQERNLLPDGEITQETWSKWAEVIAGAMYKKPRDIYMNLRQAITGLSHGPEMSKILPLIGREKILHRLK